MELFLESSKTDQYRDGLHVVIASTSNKTCPVNIMERYVEAMGLNTRERSERFLFRGLVKTKEGYRLRKSGRLSYTRARELVLEALHSIGFDKKDFGVHSLRAGGASAAANRGVLDRLFKRHGRWKSENAKDGYVKDTLDVSCSVTRKLGL